MAKAKSSDDQSSKELKDCFIITPIGGVGSETFKKADGLIKSVIDPVLSEFGYRAVPAYDIAAAGSITKQVIDHVVNDALVIANVTGLNPNVMYELALRHAFKKRVVTMAEFDTKLPFDISDQRTVFYDDSLHGAEIVKPILRSAIKAVLDSEIISNPVTESVKEAAVLSQSEGSTDITKYMLERFDRLERLVVSKSDQQAQRYSYPGKNFDSGLYSGNIRIKTNENFDLSIIADKLQSMANGNQVVIRDLLHTGKYELQFTATALKSEVIRSFLDDVLKAGYATNVIFNSGTD